MRKNKLKVIIPVAGIGSRLRPHTHTQPKALVPVAGKPILSHIVDNLINAGINDFIFILGYLGDKVESYIKSQYPAIKSSFILQEPREGTGHAVWLAKEFIEQGDALLIALGDTVFDIDLADVIKNNVSSLGVKRVDDPRNFGVAEQNSEGMIVSVTEKPAIPKSNLALVGLYFILEGTELMKALDENIRKQHKTHGEFHLTDGISKMMAGGIRFSSFAVEKWFDCGSKESLLETNAILLKKKSELTVYDFKNTIIIHPVSIASGCQIQNSIIGPNVSIGENTTVDHSILNNVIVGSYSEIHNSVMHYSVIGNDASLRGLSQSLNIGDSTEIDFN